MSTERQKQAARQNLEKARAAQSARSRGSRRSSAAKSSGLSTAEKDRLPASDFAFPKERKEPLVDAAHVRNAIARFDQVEGVNDRERDQAWKKINSAAAKFVVEVHEEDWRELFVGGKQRKR